MKYDIAALPIKKPYEMQRRTLYPHSQEKGNKPQPYDKTPPHVFLFYPMDPIHPPPAAAAAAGRCGFRYRPPSQAGIQDTTPPPD